MNKDNQHPPPCRSIHDLARHLKRLSNEQKVITVEIRRIVEADKQLTRRLHRLKVESRHVSDDINEIIKAARICNSDEVLEETLSNDTEVSIIPDIIESEKLTRGVIRKLGSTNSSGSQLVKG